MTASPTLAVGTRVRPSLRSKTVTADRTPLLPWGHHRMLRRRATLTATAKQMPVLLIRSRERGPIKPARAALPRRLAGEPAAISRWPAITMATARRILRSFVPPRVTGGYFTVITGLIPEFPSDLEATRRPRAITMATARRIRRFTENLTAIGISSAARQGITRYIGATRLISQFR